MKRIPNRISHFLALTSFSIFSIAAVTGASQQTKSILNSSIDLREDSSTYTVSVGVPESTDVNVRLNGSTLLLNSTATAAGIQYDQRISLPQAQADAALGIKRAGGQLVISIPKGDPAPAGMDSSSPPQSPMNGGFDALRNQVLSQAANMLQQIGNEDAATPGGTSSQDLLSTFLGGLAPQLQTGAKSSGFQLEDKGSAYVLSANLPEDQARNVSVNVDNERAITITTKHEKKSSSGGSSAFSSGSSTQSMTLPGPVHGEELKMDYKNGRLEVTLPKK
jgi:HSP20 family molecular chaperone IbpA